MPTSNIAQALFIEGPDAAAFAHNQFTSQVSALPNGQWQFSSWLDAQGRVRALFHLARLADERFLLILRGGDAASFVDALRRFVFRSRVTLSVANTSKLGVGSPMPMYVVDMEDDVIRLGCGAYALLLGAHANDDDARRVDDVRAGWPWLPDDALNALLPPALSLHRLGAVALDKGCYPGQEIVARLHYRGGNKRHLHHVELSRVVAAGSVLLLNNREFVRLLDVVQQSERIEALAVIADDIANNIAQHAENTSDDDVVVQLINTWPD
jgi:folate-binding protein YgfZ